MRLAAFCFLLFVVRAQSMIEPKTGPTAGFFRRDAMVLGGVFDCLLRMILSKNR